MVRGQRDVRVRRMDAEYVRDVEPGEIVRIDDSGVSPAGTMRRPRSCAMCMFEHVYFSNPASKIFGQNVHVVREKMGRQLARESPR